MKIIVYTKFYNPEHVYYYQLLFNTLQAEQVQTFAFETLAPFFESNNGYKDYCTLFNDLDEIRKEIDFVISVGGDGTILSAISLIGSKNIPLLGINLGRLGFLADIPKDYIENAISSILNRNYYIERRGLLKMESNDNLFSDFPYALNDFTILKKDTSSMIKIHTYVNGQFLNTYWSDGLIVATPTGSTGYSLSCNGPIIFPEADVFVITPVSPHNLNIRPIIIPNDNILSFEVEGRAENYLCTLDSRQEIITKETQLAVRKADFSIPLVRIGANNFIDTIREKLYWGIDSRN